MRGCGSRRGILRSRSDGSILLDHIVAAAAIATAVADLALVGRDLALDFLLNEFFAATGFSAAGRNEPFDQIRTRVALALAARLATSVAAIFAAIAAFAAFEPAKQIAAGHRNAEILAFHDPNRLLDLLRRADPFAGLLRTARIATGFAAAFAAALSQRLCGHKPWRRQPENHH